MTVINSDVPELVVGTRVGERPRKQVEYKAMHECGRQTALTIVYSIKRCS